MSDTGEITDYEDVSVYTLDGPTEEDLLRAQNELKMRSAMARSAAFLED